MKTKLCKKCGWQYNPEISSCPVCGQAHKKKNCICCNKEIENTGSNKYCYNCRSNTKKIYDNIFMENKRKEKLKDGTVKKSESIKKALDEIKVSDTMFQTYRCNQDCDNCQYDDCILPEED